MRHFKIFLTVAIAGLLLSSCYERQFTPTLGNTPVEFVYSSIDTTLNSSYIYIPVHMTEQSSTGAKAGLVFTGGTVTLREGGSRDVVEFTNDETGYTNGGDIIITSKEIFIGPYDEEEDEDGLPTNNFEIKVPNYLEFESITLNFELVADNPGTNTTMTYTATAPAEVDFTGSWSIGGNTYQITVDETGTIYSVYTPYADDPFTGSRAGNNLTINVSGPEYDAGDDIGVVNLLMCAYHTNPNDSSDTTVYLWPDESCVWEFGADGTVTLTNGTFIGFADPGGAGYYSFTGSAMSDGTVGTKM